MMKKQGTVSVEQNDGGMDSISASDPGILAFGTSVGINDDLRRSIGVEIQEIDSICSKMKDDMNRESNIRDELVKTMSHSINEVKSLDQVASDLVDNLNMNVQILVGLETTLGTALAASTKNMNDEREETKTPLDEQDLFRSLTSIHDGKKRRQEEFAEIRRRFALDGKRLQVLKHEAKSIRDSRMAVEMTNRDLELALDSSEKLIENAENELDMENLKVQRTEENLQGVKGRIEALKLSIKLKKEAAHATISEYEKNIANLTKELETTEESGWHEKNEIRLIESEIAKSRETSDEMMKHIAEVKLLITEREANISDKEKYRAERTAMFSEQQRVGQEIDRTEEELNYARRKCIELEKKKIEIENLKASNDKIEAENVIPARAEIQELKSELEKLDSFIAKRASEGDAELEAIEQKIIVEKQVAIDLDKELEEIIIVIDEKTSVLSEHQRIMDDHNDAISKELLAIEMSTNEQKEQNVELELKIKAKKEDDDQQKEIEQKEYQSLKHQLASLRQGVKLLNKTAEEEKQILDGTNKEEKSKKKYDLETSF